MQRAVAVLAAAAALWLAAVGTATAAHHDEPAGFHDGTPGHDH